MLFSFTKRIRRRTPGNGPVQSSRELHLEVLEDRCLLTTYTITDLGVVSNGIYSYAEAINNEGQIVGYSAVMGSSYHNPFLYQNGQITDLGLMPHQNGGTATAINDAGVIVGDQYRVNPSRHTAAVYNPDGSITPVPPLGENSDRFFGINNAGEAVGYSETAGGIPPHAVLYANGQLQDLGTLPGDLFSWAYGINDRGVIVGKSGGDGVTHAFVYRHGVMTDLGTLGGSNAVADAITNNGFIAGYSTPDDASGDHAFLMRHHHAMIDLGTLPGDNASFAYGVNSFGEVVGSSQGDGGARAFVYQQGEIVDLNSVVVNAANWSLSSATGVNDSGVIVGYGSVTLGVGVRVHGFMLTPNDDAATMPFRAQVAAQPTPLALQPADGNASRNGDHVAGEAGIASAGRSRPDEAVGQAAVDGVNVTQPTAPAEGASADISFDVLHASILAPDPLNTPVEPAPV